VKKKLPNAPVWCVRTKNQSFVMRQGNCITITGNTLYGAGAAKIGSIAAPNADEYTKINIGKELNRKFLTSLPALDMVIKDVTAIAGDKGYVYSIDGRKTYVKSPHKALNCLLQSSGSIFVKKWICMFYHKLLSQLGKPGWDGLWTPCSYSHDDILIAVKEEHVEKVKSILLPTIQETGEVMGLNIRMDGEALVGHTWKEVH
jgi:DNA polymerase I-like protein with 3'-5' exonuclease and polymerase domains